MLITPRVADSINQSVLCWLATVSEGGVPNVSPKEAFLHDGGGCILVANIASPMTVRNIRANPNVCVSFVDVFVQKGYKIAGEARLFERGDEGFEERQAKLVAMIGTRYPIASVIEITPTAIDEIIAPSYRLFPETDAIDRIRDSLGSYRVDDYQRQAQNEPRP